MPTLEQWRTTWTGLGVAAPADLYGQLIASYGEPHRKYHTPLHLDECLAKFSGVRSQASHPEEIELAIWFHDAIYDTKRKDNEEKSAQWARGAMLDAGVSDTRAERVRRLIMATCHDAIPAGEDAQILVDVDLSILGAAKDRFDEYERQVREEYAWVPDALFRRERKKILKSFLKRPQIYSTEHFRETHERQARENLRRSLERLGSRARSGLGITIVVYGAAVLLCTIRAVGYADGDWLLVLVALTLPWSLISVVFIWSLVHGASLWFFWLVYLGGGAANAFLIYRYAPKLYARLRHRAA